MRRLLDITLAGLNSLKNSEDTKIAEIYAERGRVLTGIWTGKNTNEF